MNNIFQFDNLSLFQQKKKELKIKEDSDQELLARSSLNIPLLPEENSDREMASLMRLHAGRSVFEREDEKMSDILNRPALPSSTLTTFGGLKREKLLNYKLSRSDLGIVKRPSSATISLENDPKKSKIDETLNDKKDLSKEINNRKESEVKGLNKNTKNRNSECNASISLVSNYSSHSDSETSSEN